MAKVKRRVGAAPGNVKASLLTFVDILFDLDATHHNRRGSTESDQVNNLRELCQMCNGDVTGEWIHHCHDPSKLGPCCASLKETKEKPPNCIVGI